MRLGNVPGPTDDGGDAGALVNPRLGPITHAAGAVAPGQPLHQQGERRVLREVERPPTPDADGTATWSLSALRKAVRSASDGLPRVSTYTLWRVLHEAGYSHQRTRTWCPTGKALRRRKAGPAVVTDPDAESKKS